MAMTRESAAKESAAKKMAASKAAGKPGTDRKSPAANKMVRKTVANEKVAGKIAAKKVEVGPQSSGRPVPHLSPEEAVAHIQALLDARHGRADPAPRRSGSKQAMHTATAQLAASASKPDAVAGSTASSSARPGNKARTRSGRH